MQLIQVGGGETMFTLADIDLHDGSIYTISVIGCNRARLCTEAVSNSFKVSNVFKNKLFVSSRIKRLSPQ